MDTVKEVFFEDGILWLVYEEWTAWVHNPQALDIGWGDETLWVGVSRPLHINPHGQYLLNDPINDWRKSRGLEPIVGSLSLTWDLPMIEASKREPWENDPEEWKNR